MTVLGCPVAGHAQTDGMNVDTGLQGGLQGNVDPGWQRMLQGNVNIG